MENNKAAIGIGLVVLGGLAFAFLGRGKPPGPAANISLVIKDSEGNVVPHNSPAALEEGQGYTLEATITNTSYRGSPPSTVPMAVIFEITAMGQTGGTDFLTQSTTQPFAEDQSIILSWPFTIDWGLGGTIGDIVVTVFDPLWNPVASATEPVTVSEALVEYAATVDIVVS